MARAVLQQTDIQRALVRIAHEILESGDSDPVLLGIPTRGTILAARLGAILDGLQPDWGAVGSLDVTMYRDDLQRHPTRTPEPTRLPDGGLDGRTVVLVDDVLSTGRTIRAALDAIGDLGRPAAVRLAVLADRGQREFPIRADYVGRNLATEAGERVNVRLAESDGADEVVIS